MKLLKSPFSKNRKVTDLRKLSFGVRWKSFVIGTRMQSFRRKPVLNTHVRSHRRAIHNTRDLSVSVSLCLLSPRSGSGYTMVTGQPPISQHLPGAWLRVGIECLMNKYAIY